MSKAIPTHPENPHYFLCEELLCPNVDKNDTFRVNMFSNHQNQRLDLDKAEPPLVFTRFENQIAKFSRSYMKVERPFKVCYIIKRNKYEVSYIIKYSDGEKEYDIIKRHECEGITEKYGYKFNNSVIDSLKTGDKVKIGDVLFKSTAYDEDMNYMFGRNLNTIYHPIENLTYEDACVISESASKKLATNFVHKVEVMINTNDVLINLYGDYENYKSFPDLGEKVKDQIVCARRRLVYSSMMYDLSKSNLMKLNLNTDAIFYSKGKVVNIEVFFNGNEEELTNNKYLSQINKYYQMEINYYLKIKNFIQPIIESGKDKFSDDLAYEYRRSIDAINPEIKWVTDKSDKFDNLLIKFTILETANHVEGGKLVNRYGGKSIIAAILPDEEMPTTVDGKRAELVLNPFGVLKRTNLGQLFELELNFIGDNIKEKMRKLAEEGKYKEAFHLYKEMMSYINKEQVEFVSKKIRTKEERKEFVEDIIKNGLFIHQPPFYGNIDLIDLANFYKAYPDIEEYKMQGGLRPSVIAPTYIMRLKHDAKSKFSARSTGMLNLKNIPTKTKTTTKELFPSTPIRMGEMENLNLFTLNDAEILKKYMNMYSLNSDYRIKAVKDILKENDIYNIKNITQSVVGNNIKEIIEEMFKSIGIEISYDDDIETPKEN